LFDHIWLKARIMLWLNRVRNDHGEVIIRNMIGSFVKKALRHQGIEASRGKALRRHQGIEGRDLESLVNFVCFAVYLCTTLAWLFTTRAGDKKGCGWILVL